MPALGPIAFLLVTAIVLAADFPARLVAALALAALVGAVIRHGSTGTSDHAAEPRSPPDPGEQVPALRRIAASAQPSSALLEPPAHSWPRAGAARDL